MGYTPGDQMHEWLDGGDESQIVEVDDGKLLWSHETAEKERQDWIDEGDPQEASRIEVFKRDVQFDWDQKKQEILDYCKRTKGGRWRAFFVFDTGEFFEEVEEAFLFKYESELYRDLLTHAFTAGRESADISDAGEAFAQFMARRTHSPDLVH